MSLLDRARERRDRRDADGRADTEAATARAIGRVVAGSNRVLELDGDERIAPSMVSLAPGRQPKRYDAHRNLFQFDYDGLHFVAGFYWDDIDHFMLAVRVRRLRGNPEWPPPSRSHDGAPKGYKRIHGLVQLADAVDRGGADER